MHLFKGLKQSNSKRTFLVQNTQNMNSLKSLQDSKTFVLILLEANCVHLTHSSRGFTPLPIWPFLALEV